VRENRALKEDANSSFIVQIFDAEKDNSAFDFGKRV
jgi:hypothetical protein